MSPALLGWLVWGAAALVAASVGIAAGPLPWRFMGESGLPAPAASQPAPDRPPVSLDPILALLPFGSPAVPQAPAEAQETGLGLILHGVVIASDPASSSAIVSGESQPVRSYGVGQVVAQDAVLAEVHGDHVVLESQGRRETLSFPERRPAASPARAGSSSVDALRALVLSQSPQAERTAPEPEMSEAEAAIAHYRERIRENPKRMLDELGLVPGESGYAVGTEATGAVLETGLRPGDVVATINGQQVGNIEQDRKLFDEVTASGRARIEVMRDGQRLVLSFPLR